MNVQVFRKSVSTYFKFYNSCDYLVGMYLCSESRVHIWMNIMCQAHQILRVCEEPEPFEILDGVVPPNVCESGTRPFAPLVPAAFILFVFMTRLHRCF